MPAPMPPAPQGAAPAAGPAGPAGPAKDPGQASQLVAGIHDQMMQLMDMMQGKLPDQDVQQFSQIVQAYQGFVEKVLGGSHGPDDEGSEGEQSPPPGAAPVESGGKPGAVPA